MKVAGVVENMTAFVTPSGERYPLFGEGGGESLARDIDAPLLARIPIEPEVASGGDVGIPAVIAAPTGVAAQVFRDLATAIVEDVLPPIEMAGCTARMMELIEQVDAT